MNLYGFTLLRNGIHYDYPYKESLQSLLGLCDEVVLALGDSHDGTDKALQHWKNLAIVPTTWDESLRQGGTILSQQTNLALSELRKRRKTGWGIYLQADEVLHEKDYDLIRRGIAEADKVGADVLSFRYLHFWQSYNQIAIGERWYPQEIRAVRLDSDVQSFGDAQSFTGWRKRLEIDATVYHYGHVREAGAYARKKKDFHRWWHSDQNLPHVLARGEAKDAREPVLNFFGQHPSFMKERMGNVALKLETPQEIVVFGVPSLWPQKEIPLESLATKILFIDAPSKAIEQLPLLSLRKPRLVEWLTQPIVCIKLMGSFVQNGMRSPQARPWSQGTQIRFHLWQRGIDLA
jgi:hypothetical protein